MRYEFVPLSKPTSERPAASRATFPDGLRGFAALWVVLFHTSAGHHIDDLKELLPRWFTVVVFESGNLGVPIFFVLSGFVMALTTESKIFDGSTSLRFVLRRLVRLTPPYYFALALGLLSLTVKSSLDEGQLPLTARDVLAYMAYLELVMRSPEINPIFWTLCIEVQFYVVFALLLLIADSLSRSMNTGAGRSLAFGIAAGAALLWPLHVTNFTPWNGCFLGFWFAFLAGVVVYHGATHGRSTRLFSFVYCALLAMISLWSHSVFVAAVAVTGSLLLAAAAGRGMSRWLSASWIQFLGLISYSLYLLHSPVTGVSFRLTRHWGSGTAAEIAGLGLAVTACILTAWIAFRLVEKPSILWSHSIKIPNRSSK